MTGHPAIQLGRAAVITGAGDGIGLRMMRERAARIGAAITLDSRPGRWSTVRLEMPTVNGPPAR